MENIKVLNCDCNQFIETEEFKELADSGRLVIVTDPPFNVGYHYGKYKDRMKADEYYAMLKRILTKADCPFVVILYPESLHRLSIELGYSPLRVVSWVYNSNTAKQHRDIGFYGCSPDFRRVRQPYKNPNDKRIKERIAKGMGGGETL